LTCTWFSWKRVPFSRQANTRLHSSELTTHGKMNYMK
jgi:hypothetical protein